MLFAELDSYAPSFIKEGEKYASNVIWVQEETIKGKRI